MALYIGTGGSLCRIEWLNMDGIIRFHARAHALVGALLSTYATVTQDYGVDFSDLPQSILDRIFFFVGEPEGWLKKVVRILVNNHRWPHTQLA